MSKIPSFQFYPGDWLKDPALRSVSLSGRGLWMDMICLMFEATPRGYLTLNGRSVSVEQLARMVGSTAEEVSRSLGELTDSGVASITDAGVIYSRRMVRDEEIRGIRRKCGSMGGNPNLVNQNRFYLTKNQPSDQAKPKQPPNQNSPPSSSSSSSTSKQSPLTPQGERFEEFWKEYPKKLYRGEAEKVWERFKVTTELFAEIMAGLNRAKKSPNWTKEGGEYIPNAARWLRAKGWRDEYPRTIVDPRTGIKKINPVYRDEVETHISTASPVDPAIGTLVKQVAAGMKV